MKRAGFTMIELIFVIVILGILAAVAVPRLSATRDDANVATGATELATLISDLGSSYTAQGTMSTDYRTMTNVDLGTNPLDMNDTNSVFTFNDCIEIVPTSTVGGAADGVMVSFNQPGGTICAGIARAAASITGWTAVGTDSNATHVFGGTGVNFN